MEPIFSYQSHVVGWLKNDGIYDEAGHPRAFVYNKAVFSLDGNYLGRVENGYVRDQRGDAVAFMKGAAGSPIPPTPRVVPTAPLTWPMPVTPQPRVIPYAASPSQHWSDMDWEVFLNGGPSASLTTPMFY